MNQNTKPTEITLTHERFKEINSVIFNCIDSLKRIFFFKYKFT